MNNKDLILKYLSGLLEGKELEAFEQKLQSSSELKAEYDKLSGKLEQLRSDSDIKYDNRYFASTLVKVKQKAEDKKQKKGFRFVPALSAGSLAVIFLFIFLSAPVEESIFIDSDELSNELYSALQETDSSELNYYIKHDMVSHYAYYGDLTADLGVEIGTSGTSGFDLPYNYNYEVLNDASSEEIENLYNTILETKIL